MPADQNIRIVELRIGLNIVHQCNYILVAITKRVVDLKIKLLCQRLDSEVRTVAMSRLCRSEQVMELNRLRINLQILEIDNVRHCPFLTSYVQAYIVMVSRFLPVTDQ